VDDQVKIRGYRIELGEIEHRLMEFPDVLETAVIATVIDAGNELQLVAFVKSLNTIDTSSLRDFAKVTLPEFMIPSHFFHVDRFPLAPSGKIDKHELARLASEGGSTTGRESLSADSLSATETTVRELFARVLETTDGSIGADDDFFNLGGTSLRCVRLFMMIEDRYDISLPLATLVEAPSVRLLSAVIDGETRSPQGPTTQREPSTNEWEWVLSILWSDILGVSDVVRTDNFFDLGGSTADATRMIGELHNVHRIDLTLEELNRAPTIAQLAAVTSRRSTMTSLVPLNTTGSTTPFFCIAGPGGLGLVFLTLSRELGPDQRFYALQAHGLERRGLPDVTLGRAAARYVKIIQSVQPHGPYLIGGHSLGGVVALKVAHLLADANEDVALLAVFDTILTPRMSGTEQEDAAVSRPREEPHLRAPRRLPKWSNLVRLPLIGWVPQSGMTQFELFTLQGIIQSRLTRRLNPWFGNTVVFVSEGEKSRNVESRWRRLLCGEWTAVSIPGDHSAILLRPNVAIMAKSLREHIDKALTRTPKPPNGQSA